MPTSPNLPVTPLRVALRTEQQRSDELRYLHHLHAVLLVALGQSVGQVAQWLDCSPRSVERWVRAYRSGGCEALHVSHGPGRPACLTTLQLQQIHSDLAHPPSAHGFHHHRWRGKLLAAHIEQHFGVQVSLRQCQRLLHIQDAT